MGGREKREGKKMRDREKDINIDRRNSRKNHMQEQVQVLDSKTH